ncbi:MAG: signal peptidase I [Armatimonadetes bacterium]|nr:signal peptidase I [Armatimonadota bacterium]
MSETQLIAIIYILAVIRLALYLRPEWVAKLDLRRQINENIDSIVYAGVVALLLIHFVVRSFYIPSGSMLDTLQLYDYILVNKLSYVYGHPMRGDIAVFHPPEETYAGDKTDLIKRVVAIEGDEIEVKDGALYLNGMRQEDPYVREGTTTGYFPRERIKPGHVFMMGDNRQNSRDSRYFGQVPLQNLVGEAMFIFFPPRRAGPLH